MLTLIIDTSTDRGIVVLARGSEVLYFEELPFRHLHARELFPAIERMLTASQMSQTSLEAVAVSVGPGSYTGVRVGVMAAKTIAYPRHLPLVSLCSLSGFSPSAPCHYAVLVDAKTRGVYLKSPGGIARLCCDDQLSRLLAGFEKVVTPRLPERLFEQLAQLLQIEERGPDPGQLARLTAHSLVAGCFSVEERVEVRYAVSKDSGEVGLPSP